MTYRRLNGGEEIGTFSGQAKTIMEWHAENKSAVMRILLCTDCSTEQAGSAEVTVWAPSNHPLNLEGASVWDMLSVQ